MTSKDEQSLSEVQTQTKKEKQSKKDLEKESMRIAKEREQVMREIKELMKAYGLNMVDFLQSQAPEDVEGLEEVKLWLYLNQKGEEDLRVVRIAETLNEEPPLIEEKTETTKEEPVRTRGMNNPEKLLLQPLRAYCHDHSVALVLKSLCERVPEAVPNYRNWDAPDVIPLVCKKVREVGYFEKIWPLLRMLMGDNIGNIQWTARVAMTIALFEVIGEIAPYQRCNVYNVR